jgi:enterochelin esterase-like enzyme
LTTGVDWRRQRGHDAFNEDLVSVIVPYVDSHYRTLTDRDHRAIAGLSMGGAQTLAVSLDDSADFAWVGVFSSGWFPNMMKDEEDTDLAKYHASGKPFRLFWVGIGQNDFFLQSSHATVALLNKYGIKTEVDESQGFHSWNVWKDYLNLFAPRFFPGTASPLGKQVLMGKSDA